jgi:prepilin-type N-terminal cleavage/methylation domain-containing protein
MNWLRRRIGGEGGFSLIEVLVALSVFTVIAIASLGVFVGAARGVQRSRMDTQAKNLTQATMESIRGLPFYLAASVSTSPDLFRTYYKGTTSTYNATSTSTSGYVPATGARDTSKGDPAVGAFYRTVIPSVAGYSGFSQRVAVQLLNGAGTVMTSPSFDSFSTGSLGSEPTQSLSAIVTTLWTFQGSTKTLSVTSRVSEGPAKAASVTLQGRLTALRVSGILPLAHEFVAEAGTISLDGSLSSRSSASAVAEGVDGVVADITRQDGAQGSSSSPSGSVSNTSPQGPLVLTDSDGTVVANLASSQLSGVSTAITSGQPSAGSSGSPVTATMMGTTGPTPFNVTNRPDTGTSTHLQLLSQPMIALQSTATGSTAAITGSGYIGSNGGSSHSAVASLSSYINGTLDIFPTAFAPNGIVQITFTSGSMSCSSAAGASPQAVASVSYGATLSYLTYNASTGVYAYVSKSLTQSNSSDPLAGVDLNTQVGVDGTGAPILLGDYIQSWSSMTNSAFNTAAQSSSSTNTSAVSIPGLITLSSKPLRQSDANSNIGVAIGVGSCTAGDQR